MPTDSSGKQPPLNTGQSWTVKQRGQPTIPAPRPPLMAPEGDLPPEGVHAVGWPVASRGPSGTILPTRVTSSAGWSCFWRDLGAAWQAGSLPLIHTLSRPLRWMSWMSLSPLRAFLVAQMVIPGLGRSPGGGHGNRFQYSCLENPHEQRSLVGYSPWGHKESDKTFASCSVQTCFKGLILKHVTSLWPSSWESAFQCRACRFDPWSGNWDPTCPRATKPARATGTASQWEVYMPQWRPSTAPSLSPQCPPPAPALPFTAHFCPVLTSGPAGFRSTGFCLHCSRETALVTQWFLPCWIWWSILSPQFIHTSSRLSHRRLSLLGKSVFTWSPQCEKWTRINTFMMWLGQGHYFVFSNIPSTRDSIFHVWGTECLLNGWVRIRGSKVQLTGQIWPTAYFL